MTSASPDQVGDQVNLTSEDIPDHKNLASITGLAGTIFGVLLERKV